MTSKYYLSFVTLDLLSSLITSISRKLIRNAVGGLIPFCFKSEIARMLRKLTSVRSKIRLNSSDEKPIYQRYYKSEIDELETLLDRDLSFWRK